MNPISKFVSSYQRMINGLRATIHITEHAEYNQRKLLLQWSIVNCHEPGVSKERYCDHEIIVSLTTYGKRLHDVALTIESLMLQTLKPNRIVLWLDHSFEEKRLPHALRLQQERGLEIRFCTDVRAYKKLYPALCAFPEATIITADDILYEYDMVEQLVNAYLSDPQYIYAHRCHRILLGSDGKPIPYNKWAWERSFATEQQASHRLFATGCGGVLYPPKSLAKEALNEALFKEICPYADDVWWKAMALLNDTRIKMVYSHDAHGNDFLINDAIQDVGLRTINVDGEALNDKQIADVFSHFNLYPKLQDEE